MACFACYSKKGPFVDGSNWHSYRPDEIVRMFDDHEIEGLSKLLRGDGIRYLNPVGSDRVEDFVLKASSDVEARGGAADLVVVVLDRNPPAIRWLIQSLNYRIMPEIRGAAINAEGVQTGTFAGKPVLEVFAELGGKPPSVHVLDLERFASYTRYFPVDGEDYLHLHVEDINQERAIGIVEEHPDLLSVLGGRQLTPEEGIAELMTRVVFSISAAGRWEIRDGHQGAVSAYLEFEDPA